MLKVTMAVSTPFPVQTATIRFRVAVNLAAMVSNFFICRLRVGFAGILAHHPDMSRTIRVETGIIFLPPFSAFRDRV